MVPCNRSLVRCLCFQQKLPGPLYKSTMGPGALVALVVPFRAELVVAFVGSGLRVVPARTDGVATPAALGAN